MSTPYKVCSYPIEVDLAKVVYNDLPTIQVDVVYNRPVSSRYQLNNVSDSVNVFKNVFPDGEINYREVFQILFIGPDNRLLGWDNVFYGGSSRITVDPKIIFQKVLAISCQGIVIGHNHPMASSEPSNRDIEFTSVIKQLCELLDIVLLDHIILGEVDYFSFTQNGLL
tara:strand:+ start:185 stop:688 length:504 start_codon:yes stop_codon:yes gene_type:complete